MELRGEILATDMYLAVSVYTRSLEPWDCLRAPREGGLTEQRTQL